jgi:hypothetical protein
MTPPPNYNHPCDGCFLQEQRRGRVCPAARDAYALEDLEAQRQGEILRALVLAEAGGAPSLTEMVRREAQQGPQELPAASRPTLPVASLQYIPDNSRKEAVHDLMAIRVIAPRRSR